jgi:hypothetical protein
MLRMPNEKKREMMAMYQQHQTAHKDDHQTPSFWVKALKDDPSAEQLAELAIVVSGAPPAPPLSAPHPMRAPPPLAALRPPRRGLLCPHAPSAACGSPRRPRRSPRAAGAHTPFLKDLVKAGALAALTDCLADMCRFTERSEADWTRIEAGMKCINALSRSSTGLEALIGHAQSATCYASGGGSLLLCERDEFVSLAVGELCAMAVYSAAGHQASAPPPPRPLSTPARAPSFAPPCGSAHAFFALQSAMDALEELNLVYPGTDADAHCLRLVVDKLREARNPKQRCGAPSKNRLRVSHRAAWSPLGAPLHRAAPLQVHAAAGERIGLGAQLGARGHRGARHAMRAPRALCSLCRIYMHLSGCRGRCACSCATC